jgi:site-specific DNA-methyltransferase (adenine-specific)
VDKDTAKVARTLRNLKRESPEQHAAVRARTMTAQAAARTISTKKRKAKQQQQQKEHARKAAEAAASGPPMPDPVVCGDCLVKLPEVPRGSVTLAFADSPYNIGVDYGRGKKADLMPRADFLFWCGRWMKEVAATLTPNGSFWVLINDENAAEFKGLLEATGLHIRQWLIWYETFGVNHPAGFNRCHRHLFWTVKNPKDFIFNSDAVLRPSDRQEYYTDKRANPEGKTWDSVWGVNPAVSRLTATCDERLDGFPTQLPLALLRPIIGCASAEGDLVMDPFCGSGTTGVAAVEAGRRFLGIEENRRSAAVANTRIRGALREQEKA